MSRTTPHTYVPPPDAALLPDPEVRPADITAPLDLAKVFGRAGRLDAGIAIEVEVGFGKGGFLLAEATSRPDTLFLGIEHAAPYLRLVRYRALLKRLANLRLLAGNADDVFRRLLPAGELAAVHILFPDPWPKRRHHRRRLVNPTFLAEVARTLAPGGAVNIATDDADYAAAIQKAAAAVPALEPQPRFQLGDDLASRTHYARKLSARAVPFHARSWTRQG